MFRAVSQEWQGRLMWNENEINQLVVTLTFDQCMASTRGFHGIPGMGRPIDTEQQGWVLVIYDQDRDLLMTKVRGKDLPNSHLSDFRCRRAINSSSLHMYFSNLYGIRWCSLACNLAENRMASIISMYCLELTALNWWVNKRTNTPWWFACISLLRCPVTALLI